MTLDLIFDDYVNEYVAIVWREIRNIIILLLAN